MTEKSQHGFGIFDNKSLHSHIANVEASSVH